MTEKLTPATARALEPGQSLYDHEITGLQLRARATKKTWHYRHVTRAGKERRPAIGTFPATSLSHAREIAKALRDRVALGEDPSGDWKAARDAPTLSDLCDKFLKEWAPDRLKPSTLKSYTQLIETHIKPGLGAKRLPEITTVEVDKFLKDVFERKFINPLVRSRRKQKTAETQACHVRRLLWRLFTAATEYFKFEIAENPVVGSVVYREGKRRRYAKLTELPEIWKALDRLAVKKPLRAACIMSLFLTGGRVSEILNARADQLQPKEDGRFVLRLGEHKTDRYIGEKDVILPPEVVAILKRLKVNGKEPLFGHVSLFALQKTWRKVREEAGCPDLMLLDARRTFASFALSIGKSLDQIGELLFHTNPKTTKGYSFLIDELKQASADEIAGAISEAARGTQQ